MGTDKPLIEVIIPVYNGAAFIGEAVASVFAQSWPNVSVIIVDDGSTDDTVAVVEALAKTESRIQLIKRPHLGVSATLNAGIAVAKADYIAFIDADDLWHQQKLEKQMHQLSQSDALLCFCLLQEFESFADGNNSNTHKARPQTLKGYSKTAFLAHREVFDIYGLFDEELETGDFVEWQSRVIRGGQAILMIDEVLAYRRIHHANMTITSSKTAYLSILKAHLDEKRKTNQA